MVDRTIPWEQALLRYQANWLLRMLGFKQKDGQNTYRFKWGSITRRHYGLAWSLSHWSDRDADSDPHWTLNLSLFICQLWLKLPKWLPDIKWQPELGQDTHRSWGFYWYWGRDWDIGQLCIQRGSRGSKFINFPWQYTHVRREELSRDGTWITKPKWDAPQDEQEQYTAMVACETHPYQYNLRSGVIQRRLATIHVSEMEWRPKGTKRWAIFRKIRRSIEIEFNDEIGEKAGSWKGGCTGCGYEMKINELPVECLRRMERERKF